jgi:hypothetical protein
MLSLVEVGPRVAVLGRVATAYVPAFHAYAQMDPGVADLQAILTPAAVRIDVFFMILDVRAARHRRLLFRILIYCRARLKPRLLLLTTNDQ